MYEIMSKETLAPGLVMLKIRSPEVAKKVKPGQFVIVRADEYGERIPLSVADFDQESLTVIIQEVGVSTRKLTSMEPGESILNLSGPLGVPSQIKNYGKVAVISGCFGTGPGFALARALKQAGNQVIYIIEARNKDWLFWLDRIKKVSDKLIITCGGGPAEGIAEACNAISPLQSLLENEKLDRVYAIGCTFMMMECVRATPKEIEARVSLMPLMVDGTGMCGACRCSVGGEVKFGCVDGPEFDGHKVDWDLLIERARSYLEEETSSMDLWERDNWHKALDAKMNAKNARNAGTEKVLIKA